MTQPPQGYGETPEPNSYGSPPNFDKTAPALQTPAAGNPPPNYAPPQYPSYGYPPAPQYGYAGARPDVPTYLAQAILVTLFCCLPFGIVSIVFASKVSSLLAAGDVNGAQQASKSAKTWAVVSFAVGLAFLALYIILIAAGIATFHTAVTSNPTPPAIYNG